VRILTYLGSPAITGLYSAVMGNVLVKGAVTKMQRHIVDG